jgi:hypothetical protein
VAIGHSALSTQSFTNSNTPWNSDNVAVGFEALYSNQPTDTATGTSNTAAGTQALRSNTTGSSNTANGAQALFANTTGFYNIATGSYALNSNTTGNSNSASGYLALRANTTGYENLAFGREALRENTTANYNVAVGSYALLHNVVGEQNTAIGDYALDFSTTHNNAALGYAALYLTTTGGNNTAAGSEALQNNTTGSSNIALGFQAGLNLDTGSNNIDIGNQGVAAESATIRIGTGQTRAFIAGIRGITTGVNDAATVVIDSAGQLGTVSSSRRYKEDIADMGEASARLQALRPVTFRYKKPYTNGEKPIQFGLIAEEVAETFPELAVFNAEGQPETVKYQDLTPLLLNEVQKQQRQLQTQQRRADARDAELAALKQEVAALKAKDQAREARLTRLENALDTRPARTVSASLDLK